MIFSEVDRRFYIASSSIPGAGQGLFARVPLAKGDELEVVGVLVRPRSMSDVCTHFADAHKVRVGKNLLVPLGCAAMVNHSMKPNMKKVIRGTGPVYAPCDRS